jgi:hypothetical protein
MRTALISLAAALACLAAPVCAAAAEHFETAPFAARSGAYVVGVNFTFKRSARDPKVTFAGRSTRVRGVEHAPRAFYATVNSSRGLRVGRMYRMTLTWRAASGTRTVTRRLYLHRRFPGGRG